jgi:DNA replication ATP-dependent helicase Dna2
VIDLSEARFADQQRLDGSWADSDLNMEQERAVQLMARAHDYALVRGLPGAGKTHTLAAGIRRVMRSGRKVLVSAHTNAAVDNVLSRLIALGEKPLRVGDQSKVSDAVKPYTLGSSGCAYASVEQLSGILSSSRCVGCTCSGVHHPALAQLTFDMCVIDEASQVLLPASLRCLSRAHSFTLCGDHAQLPPLVRFGRLNPALLRCDTFDDNPRGKRSQVTNEEARRGGLSVSLFERLAEARPETLAEAHAEASPASVFICPLHVFAPRVITAQDDRVQLTEAHQRWQLCVVATEREGVSSSKAPERSWQEHLGRFVNDTHIKCELS